MEDVFILKDVSPVMASYAIHGAVAATIRQYVYNPAFNASEFPLEKAKEHIVIILKEDFLSQSRGLAEAAIAHLLLEEGLAAFAVQIPADCL